MPVDEIGTLSCLHVRQVTKDVAIVKAGRPTACVLSTRVVVVVVVRLPTICVVVVVVIAPICAAGGIHASIRPRRRRPAFPFSTLRRQLPSPSPLSPLLPLPRRLRADVLHQLARVIAGWWTCACRCFAAAAAPAAAGASSFLHSVDAWRHQTSLTSTT